MRLITNENKDSQSHLSELKKILLSSEQIVICSGWMKFCGLSPLLRHISKALQRGAQITVYTNREHTEQKCVERLARLPGLKHFNVPRPTYLHTKFYYGRAGDAYSAVLGSANITSGGLWKNEELSSQIDGTIGDYGYEQLEPYMRKLTALESACRTQN